MKTDQFDDAFRRKVEELHPSTYPEEVARIAGYVRQNLPLSFWQKFGTGITYSVTAATITALLSTLFYQNYVNKTLLKQVAVLNQKVEKLATVVAQKTDTVVVFKYKNADGVSQDNVRQTSLIIEKATTALRTKNTFENKPTVQSVAPLIASANEKTAKTTAGIANVKRPRNNYTNDVAKESENKIPASKNETVDLEDKNLAYEAKEPSSGLARDIGSQKNKTLTSKSNNSKDIDLRTGGRQTKTETLEYVDAGAEPQPNNAILLSALLPKPLHLDSTFRPVSHDLPATGFKNFAVSTNAPQATPRERLKINWPDVSLKNLRFGVGLGSSVAQNQLGAGLLTEILVSNRWSITTGLGAATSGKQEFDDEDQFKQRTKEDFKDRSRDPQNNPPNFRIRDIRASERLVVLPLYVNYRIPLKNDFTFMVSTGSDFHLSSTRSTSFRRQEFGPAVPRPNQNDSFVEKLPNRFFTNLVFMVGIEKRWKNISLQLNPSLKFQVKNVSHQHQSPTMGLQLRAFYRIGK